MDYDALLNKMNLFYMNGNLYHNTQHTIPNNTQSPNSYKEPQERQLTKEEYIQYIRQMQLKKLQSKKEQAEKRKLLISANGNGMRINTNPNSFFNLKR